MSERVSIHNKTDHVDIHIRIKKNTKALMYILLAGIPWFFLLYKVVALLLAQDYFWYKVILLLILLIWMFAGAAGSVFLTWLYFGRERILLHPKHILIEKPLVIYNRRNYYPIKDIYQIRVDKETYKISRNGEWVETDRTVIAFDTPNKKVFFARGIEVGDAEKILIQFAKSGFFDEKQFTYIQKT